VKRFVIASVVALSTVLDAAGDGTTKTVWDGVYTKPQAARGEQSYKRACGYCHRDNLQGDEGPALIGSRFTFQWNGRTLKDLFVTISTTMPDDAPGTLPPNTYADIVSFLLRENETPAGEVELPDDADALAQISFAARPPKF
jgi:mono/diheme cytochrome c family protein